MRNGAVTSSCASGDVHGAADHTSVHTTSSNAAQDKQKSLGSSAVVVGRIYADPGTSGVPPRSKDLTLKYAMRIANDAMTAKWVAPMMGEFRFGANRRRKVTRRNTSFTPPPIKI